MERHTDNVQNLAGDAVSAVTVTVRRVSDNALASLFSDNLASPTVKANPFTNDADGELFFYAFNNDYNIELSGPISETRLGVTLFDQNDSVIRRNILEIIASGAISQGDVALVDVTAGAVSITLPSDPGALVQFSDIVIQHLAGDITANNITIDRNGELIGGVAADVVMDIADTRAVLVWGGSTLGWAIDLSSGFGTGGNTLDGLTDVTLTAPDTGAVLYKSAGDWLDTFAIEIDPAAGILLKFNDVLAFQVTAGGASIHPSTGLANGTLELFDDTGNSFIVEKDDTFSVGVLKNLDDGFGIVLQAADAGSVVVNMLACDPDGSVDQYYDAELRTATGATGEFRIVGSVDVASDSAGTPQTTITLYDLDQSHLLGFFGFGTSSPNVFEIINRRHGGTMLLGGQTAAGVDATFLTADPVGALTGFFNNLTSFRTQVGGIDAVSTVDNNPFIAFFQDDLTTRNGFVQAHGTNGVIIQNEVNGTLFTLTGEDTGGTPRTFLVCDPDGDTKILDKGVLEARTKVAGFVIENELEIDGDLNHDGTNIGYFGTAPQPITAAYTQTFSAVTRTHANPTGATLTDSTGGSANQTVVAVPPINGSGATTAQEAAIDDNFADVTDEINKVIADLANVKELLNSVIDDRQTYGDFA